MSSITSQIGLRHASMESSEMTDVVVDGHLDELHQATTDNLQALSDQHAVVLDAGNAFGNIAISADSLSALVNNTLALHEDGEMDERSAKALEVSVEAFLRVSGCAIPVSAVLPSFESAVNYSAEAEEKKEGVVSRLKEQLYKAWVWLVEQVTKMVNYFRRNTAGLKQYADRIGVAAGKIKAKDKPEGTVSMGAAGRFTLTSAGVQSRPSEVINASMHNFQHFSGKWMAVFEPVNEQMKSFHSLTPVFANNLEEALRKITALNEEGGVIYPTPFRSILLRVEHSSDRQNTVPKIHFDHRELLKDNAPTQCPILEYSELQHGAATAKAALVAVEKVEKSIDDWLSKLTRLVGQLKTVPVSKMDPGLREPFSFMLKLLNADSTGWSLALESMSSVIKANLDYLKKSVGKYSTRGTNLAGMNPYPTHKALPAS